jgi:hypothetical protein
MKEFHSTFAALNSFKRENILLFHDIIGTVDNFIFFNISVSSLLLTIKSNQELILISKFLIKTILSEFSKLLSLE